jgi:hypothetical protein
MAQQRRQQAAEELRAEVRRALRRRDRIEGLEELDGRLRHGARGQAHARQRALRQLRGLIRHMQAAAFLSMQGGRYPSA